MKKTISVFGAALLLSACAGETIEQSLLYVDSHPVACVGEGQHLCLRVRHSEEQDWSWHYGSIQGFSYQWGSSYSLVYARHEIENPMADGPSEEWMLLEVISETEDDVGTVYGLDNVEMLDFTVTYAESVYAFIGYPFTCAEDLDCQSLAGLSGSLQRVDLRFRYLGDGGVELVLWE